MNTVPLLEMKDIVKSFGPVNVLDKVSIRLERGQVLGLIGENGAGKSTLIKILCGIYTKDAGDIYWEGKKVHITDAMSAQRLGISTIYQELSVMPHLNAAQNIFINRELTAAHAGRFFLAPFKEKRMHEIADRILHKELETNIPLDKPARLLPLAQKQMIEIARTVYADTQLIIMDEPTASLQAKERAELFKVIRDLRSRGKAIIFISHHLDELMEICDQIAILRDGNKVADGSVQDFSIEKIITCMVGRSLETQFVKAEDVTIGNELLKVERLSKQGAFTDVSFTLHNSEILGIVGLEGCGKNEVIRSLFGILKADEGTVAFRDKPIKNQDVKDAMNHGFAFVPAERKVQGLFPRQDLAWNTTIASLNKIHAFGGLNHKLELQYAGRYMQQLHTKAVGPKQNINRLSGGNQQKVMFARWIMTDADVFLLEEPTRGIDVNAKTEVYAAIADCVRASKGVIVVSSEEEEVLGICDRILVMRDGRISAELDAKKTDTAEIKRYSVKNMQNEGETRQ